MILQIFKRKTISHFRFLRDLRAVILLENLLLYIIWIQGLYYSSKVSILLVYAPLLQ